jgi:pyrroloquinoline quinone biosynthesis protein D
MSATDRPRMTARPQLATHVRLQWDAVRGKHVLLTPEGVLVLNETAAAIAERCDGQRSVTMIAAELGAQYGQAVDDDVLTLLQRLADKRLLVLREETEEDG